MSEKLNKPHAALVILGLLLGGATLSLSAYGGHARRDHGRNNDYLTPTSGAADDGVHPDAQPSDDGVWPDAQPDALPDGGDAELVNPDGGDSGLDEDVALLVEGYGQSNMVITTATPVLGLDGSVNQRNSRDGGPLITLVETSVESPLWGGANWWSNTSPGHVMVVGNDAVGGQTYAQLAQGTGLYNNAQYDAAEVNARHAGPEQPIIWWQQGEQNNGDSAATYDGHLDTLQANWQSDYNTRNGTSYVIPLAYGQVGNWPWSNGSLVQSLVALGQAAAWQDNPLLDCIGPTYNLSYQSSGAAVHLDNVGARRLGAYYAKAAYWRYHLGYGQFQPLHLTSCSAVSNVITCNIAGGVGDIAADTTNMRNRHTAGFEYTDGSGSPAGIDSYSVNAAARTVALTLNKEAASGGQVAYGLTAGFAGRIGGCTTCNGTGGNIRDSDSTASTYTAVPLYNWLLVDQLTLASYSAGSATAPSWADTQSCRMNATNDYLSVPQFTAANGATAFTWTFWVFRTTNWCGAEGTLWGRGGQSENQFDIRCNSSGRLKVYIATNLTNYVNWQSATSVFAGSTWYHVGIVYDGSQGTANNRLLVYVNGIDISAAGTYTGTMPTALTTPTADIEMAFGQTPNTGNSVNSLSMRDMATWSSAIGAVDMLDLATTAQNPDGDISVSPTHLYRCEGDSDDYGSAAPAHLIRWSSAGFTSAHP